MSLTATIGSVQIVLEGSLSLKNKIDERTQFSLTVIDTVGNALFRSGDPVEITDSIQGTLFTGFVKQPQCQLLYPTNQKLWVLTCVDTQWLLDKRTSNKIYNNQYAGTILVDQIQRYCAADGASCAAALRWDELEADWAAGTLTGVAATTNATDGNAGDGDLELALAGTAVTFLQQSQADFDFAGVISTGVAFPATGGITLAPVQAVKLMATQGIAGLSNAYLYVKIWTGSYTIAASDVLYYTLWIPDTAPQKMAAIDFVMTDGTTLRDNQAIVGVDTQGIGPHPQNDLSGLATNQWYSRRFFLDGGGAWVGKTIAYVSVAFEGNNTGDYTAYFQDVYIGNGSTTKVTFFSTTATATQTTPQQLQTSGYSDLSCTVVTAYGTSGFAESAAVTVSGVGVCGSSYVSWDVSLQSVANGVTTYTSLPSDVTLVVSATIDGQNTFLPCTNNGSIPGLLPGMDLGSNTFHLAYTFANNSNDPTVTPYLTRVAGAISPAYACSKSDSITKYNESTGWASGTLTNLVAGGNNQLQLSGYARTWNDANYSSQTIFGSSSPLQGILAQRFYLQSGAGANADVRSRLDFAGTWQNFTAEVDVTLISGNVNHAIEYRTTGWQNGNNTGAYYACVNTASIFLARGTNSSTGSGTATNIGSPVTLSLTAGDTHRLKVVVSGSSHKVYLDDVLYINQTDSTYGAAGNIALRFYNNSGSTQTAYFDNFGVVASLSGTWVSPAIDIHALGTISNSALNLEIDPAVNTTICTFLAEISLNNGTTWTSLTNDVMTAGYYQSTPVTGLTAGTNVSSMTQVRIRLTINATTASTGSAMPDLTACTLWVIGAYSSSGTRVSPSLSLSAVGRAGTAIVNWNAITPTNTTLAVATSLNGGSTWQSVAAPGDAISGISTQPDPIEDTFAVDSSASYTQSDFAGGSTGSWTWDTANSRLEGSGGMYGTLLYTTALTAADNQVAAVFDQADGSGLIANYVDSNDLYFVQIWDGSASGTQNSVKLFKRSAGTSTQLGTTVTISFPRGSYKRFVLDVQGGVLTVSMDGAQLIQHTDGSPLGAGQSGLLLNALLRCYGLRIQQYGEDVSALSLLTKLTLTSTDPGATPQVLDLQAMVSSPSIGPGALEAQKKYQRTFISNNLAEMTTDSDYWSDVVNSVVTFQPRNAVPAPWVLSSANYQLISGQPIGDVLLANLQLSNSGDLYRNRQIMQGALATSAFVEIKIGDGSTRSWNVSFPLAAPPASIALNGQAQTFGVKGVDTGKNFYYQLGSNAIDQDSAGTILSEADSFVISYTGQYTQDVVLDNTSLPGTITQADQAAIDGTTGIVEAVQDASGLTVDQATVQGNQYLSRYGNVGRTIQFVTTRAGLAQGQQLSCFVPELNLNNVQMLITEVDVAINTSAAVTGGLLYWYTVTATEGPNLGSWVRLFTNVMS